MKAIVAVAEDWGIGKDNQLLFSIPEDLKFFRDTTHGNVIIMGRKTLESFPGGKPLKGRTNIVLTSDRNYVCEGAYIVHSTEELICLLSDKKYDRDNVFVVGGGSVYSELLLFTDMVYVTRVFACKEADTFFPNLDEYEEWEIASSSDIKEYEGTKFRFDTYVKKKTD